MFSSPDCYRVTLEPVRRLFNACKLPSHARVHPHSRYPMHYSMRKTAAEYSLTVAQSVSQSVRRFFRFTLSGILIFIHTLLTFIMIMKCGCLARKVFHLGASLPLGSFVVLCVVRFSFVSRTFIFFGNAKRQRKQAPICGWH